MLLKDIMTCETVVIGPDGTVQKAAALMDDYDVDMLPVCDGGRLVGILSAHDIVGRAVATGRDPKTTLARDVMTLEAAYCFEDQDVHEAVQLLEDKKFRHLPVLNRDRRVVGVVSLRDLTICHVIAG